MKNIINLNSISLLILSFGILNAAPITVDVAKNNALQWMKSKNHRNYTIKKELLVNNSKITSRTKKHLNKYKILELQPKGWVIVSLDDVIKPIIGYGDSKIDSKLPPGMIEYLNNIEKLIDYINKHPKLQRKKSNKKILYSANDYGYVVRPLLWMGSNTDTEEQGIRWDQGTYYNALTPLDADGYHTWVGCVATAMGQLMRYWKYPSMGKGNLCYTPNYHPEYGEQCADFGATTYDWENMPLTLTSDNDAVAQALYHAGVAVYMDYGPIESGAGLGDQLKSFFNYQVSIFLYSSGFSTSEWNSILRKELDEARPIMYSGRTPNSGGHQFIIDGYDTDGYYHFNWGWGGYGNGKFTLENIDYSHKQEAYIIAPTDNSPQVIIQDSHLADCIVEQLSLKNSSKITKLLMTYLDIKCANRDINSIEALNNLKYIHYLDLGENNLQGTLDLSNKTVLEFLRVDGNNFTYINLANISKIDTFIADNNMLQGTLNLSNQKFLSSLAISNNNISNLLLPNNNNFYSFIDLSNNPKLNILEVQNLKNIKSLYAEGTEKIACWQKNALKNKNKIKNISIGCKSNPSDLLDTDEDGINNLDDADDDNDGINDLIDDDIDGDGVSNEDEMEAGSDPLNPKDTKKPKKFMSILMDDITIIVPLD